MAITMIAITVTTDYNSFIIIIETEAWMRMARKKHAKNNTAYPSALHPKNKTSKSETDTYSHQIQGYQPFVNEAPNQIQKYLAKPIQSHKSRKRIAYIIVILILFAVFVFSAIQLILYLKQSYHTKKRSK